VRSALGSNLGDLVFTVDRIFRSVFAFLPHGEAWRFLNRLPKINALSLNFQQQQKKDRSACLLKNLLGKYWSALLSFALVMGEWKIRKTFA